MLIILPSPIPRVCHLGSVILRSFISQKTAPAGLIIHGVASQTCLFHASVMSSSQCPACTQKHAAAHASSCSISRLLISREARESEGFFPASLANSFLGTFRWVGATLWAFRSPKLVLAPLPYAILCWCLSSCKLFSFSFISMFLIVFLISVP